MKNIMITGASGFLGKNLIKQLSKINESFEIIGICHSESNTKKLERIIKRNDIKNIKLYNLNIVDDKSRIINLIKRNKIEYIIHAAALKHVGICESNPTSAIKTNIIGSLNILEAAVECNVKNVIAISTDKANDPTCTYGMTKKLMEEMYLSAGFGVFRGVNFLFSSQSVLEVWDDSRKNNCDILVNKSAIRYFSTVEEICEKIIKNIDFKNVFSVETCYEISILDLQKAFSGYHNYWKVSEYIPLEIEKTIESLPIKSVKIKNPDVGEITKLLKEFYENDE